MNYIEMLICAVIAILISVCSIRSLAPLYEDVSIISDKIDNVQIELDAINLDTINPFANLIGLENIVID